jgi:glutathione gamma-glutamylcysteinyltransferase
MFQTLYRRPLPTDTIAFSSREGRQVFAEALAAGCLDGYFPLAEQFHTQADPAYCGLGSLVMALNALAIDPGRLWKGPWRWFGEELLDCCVPLEQVRKRGLDLDELACLARCNGAEVSLERAESAGVERWREALESATRGGSVLVASYDRASLGQTGAGHFSPIGGYHAARDVALVLDVARFKYPPHWLSAERLWRAMLPIDPATSRSRGWIQLRARERAAIALAYSMQCDGNGLDELAAQLHDVVEALGLVQDVSAAAQAVAPLVPHVEIRTPSEPSHRDALGETRAALRSLPAHADLTSAAGADRAELVGLLLLAVLEVLPAEHRARIGALIGKPEPGSRLAADVTALGAQLVAVQLHAAS